MLVKVLLVLAMHAYNFKSEVSKFRDGRPWTLYDHFQVPRDAKFDEIKKAKDDYLAIIKEKSLFLESPDRDDKVLWARYSNYNMTKEQAMDAYNVLTNHALREQYDKHNVYYSEEDFVKKKGKSIPSIEKWLACGKCAGSVAPYSIMILMSTGAYATTGRQLAITGLVVIGYVMLEMSKPADFAGTVDGDNWVVALINKHHSHPYMVKLFGEEAKFFTVYMLGHFLKSILWHAYFQGVLAVSRIVDLDPEAEAQEKLTKIGKKQLKVMLVLELMNPQRAQEELDKEYSPDLMKIYCERNGLPPPEEAAKAAEPEKKDEIAPSKLEIAAAENGEKKEGEDEKVEEKDKEEEAQAPEDDEPDLDMKPASATLIAPNPDNKPADPIAEAYAKHTADNGPANGTASVDFSAWAAENIPQFTAEYTEVKKEDLDTPEKLLAAQEKLLAYQAECVKYAESLKK